MFGEWLREAFEIEISPEEIKSNEALSSIAATNDLGMFGTMQLVSTFNGFNHSIIADKVNFLATPVLEPILH